LFKETWNLDKYTWIVCPSGDVAVVAGETAGVITTGVLVAVGVGVLVEPEPQAERTRKVKRSKVPMIAFESVTRRDTCE
jgi:hypothetical protein